MKPNLWMNGWLDGWMGGWMESWGQDSWTIGCVELVDVWVNGRMDPSGHMDEGMTGTMDLEDVWLYGQMEAVDPWMSGVVVRWEPGVLNIQEIHRSWSLGGAPPFSGAVRANWGHAPVKK